ncbi:response regulator [Paradesulfitobacterium ferrireducens]|uniref:response regulator n=1 Tax=Paradesulfitobacterium ferrireducens TaxID=2816476 RepID=UPI001A8C8234|nr:response regulator transcription factor [Paradesulfitobacterium ferrireducens]
MEKLTVVLVDDHQVIRKGLRLVLEDKGEIEVIAEASTGEEGIEICTRLGPDVAVMDLSLPGISGVEAIKRIKELNPKQRVLALTMHEDALFLEKVLSAGGNGFVLKRAADEELLAAIKAVCRGEVYIDTGLQAYLVTRALKPEGQAKSRVTVELTAREKEILQLVALGHSNQEIAEKLIISVKTVENHKTRIKEKLGITSRSKLVRYAMDQGLI